MLPVRGDAGLLAPAAMCGPSATNARRAWLDGLRARSGTSAGCRPRCCSTTPGRWSSHHDAATREVAFNARFHAFARYWGFRPRACAPYRARTKGKDERGVGYVKSNAIAGRRFESWAALEAHLARGCARSPTSAIHGTTGEAPVERFAREEAAALQPLGGTSAVPAVRELTRRVQADGCVEVDTNNY